MPEILNKKRLIMIVLVLSFALYIYFERGKSFQSVGMFIYIEKKEHHIEPGKYLKMWVVGSNANDVSPDKKRYKVMIEDSRIYNLLEEGNEYFVSIQGVKKRNQSDYIYTFGQLGLPGGTQLSGEGKIE